jgi:hypothetical protein
MTEEKLPAMARKIKHLQKTKSRIRGKEKEAT